MMKKNIIEKLGIKGLKHTLVSEGFFNSRVYTSFVSFEVRELEQQRNEMLEISIDTILTEMEMCPNIPEEMILAAYSNFVTVIEKATGKSWKEIKELII